MNGTRTAFGTLIAWSLAAVLASHSAAPAGKNGGIATVHPLATDAAIDAIRRGGNAVDATVAAMLTLGVVDGFNSGIGGGCFLLIRGAGGKIAAIDGRETAPAKAARDMFLREGRAHPELSQTGALAVGIPGSLQAYDLALREFGKLKLGDLLLPAADLAERGFPVSASYASELRGAAKDLRRFEESRKTFLKSTGEPYVAGEILKQPALAGAYRAIARDGVEWFYQGEFARRIEAWMRENGGLITREDMARYRVARREPIRTKYRGLEILGFPPPSSGGVHVAQILNILEFFPSKSQPTHSAESIHLIAEAMKLAFADRAHWLGDPAFARVPLGLVSPRYAESLARRIQLDKATIVPTHGAPDQYGDAFFGKHTTHVSAADAEGNWVACTATVNTSFGSKVVIPGTGVVMNNQMDDFSIQPGVPNFFGLIGAEANAVAPGKRPLSSMSPTIVQKEGVPILSLGAAGGPTIISQVVLILIHVLDHKMDVEEALRSPRFHHQWKPDALRTEPLPESTIAALKRRGHVIALTTNMGVSQIVARTDEGFTAAHDPRVQGKAATW